MNTLHAKQQLLYCPGELIQETIDEIGMSQIELAERMGRSESKLNELIKGKAPITTKTAIKLSRIIGRSVEYWLNKENRYQLALAQIGRLQNQEDDITWLNSFNIPDLIKYKIVPKSNDRTEQIESLLKFFRIGSSNEWDSIYAEKSVSFKIALKYTTAPGPISVWLRLGERDAEERTLVPYDKSALRKILPNLHLLSYEHPDDWRQQLQDKCAACGLAIVYSPMMKSAPISGAAYWIKNGRTPLIQLTSRYKNNHAFWFHFYHELAHILLHGKKEISLKDADSNTGDTQTLSNITEDWQKEDEANTWASKQLIPLSKQNALNSMSPVTKEIIVDLARQWKIHAGILVGSLARQDNSLYKNRELMSLQEKVEF